MLAHPLELFAHDSLRVPGLPMARRWHPGLNDGHYAAVSKVHAVCNAFEGLARLLSAVGSGTRSDAEAGSERLEEVPAAEVRVIA